MSLRIAGRCREGMRGDELAARWSIGTVTNLLVLLLYSRRSTRKTINNGNSHCVME